MSAWAQAVVAAYFGPALAKRINKTLQRADQIQTMEGEGDIDWFAPIVADAEAGLAAEIMDGWDPDAVNMACIQSQKERMFIQNATGGEPTWASVFRAGDDERYVRNASAVATKAAARYPFVEPTPFER